jgi:SET domain-containing protein
MMIKVTDLLASCIAITNPSLATQYSPRPLPHFLEVKISLIPGAGLGLFAKRALRADRKLGRYRGDYYKDRAAADGLPAHRRPYLMDTIEGGIIDGYSLHNHMRWANHSSEPNAIAFLMEDGVVFFHTLRRIEAGEEIYIDYGYDPTVSEAEEKRMIKLKSK